MGHSTFAQSSGVDLKAAAHPASFSLFTDREAVVSLDGLWRFHPGDDPRWASPAFDDSAWTLLRSDQPWATQGYANMSGFAWYRFAVQTPSPAEPLALPLPSILTDYEVYQDGNKIGGVGRMPPHGSLRFNQTLLYHLAPAPAGSRIQLAIRVWHHPTFAALSIIDDDESLAVVRLYRRQIAPVRRNRCAFDSCPRREILDGRGARPVRKHAGHANGEGKPGPSAQAPAS